jgi:3-oxoacyl-[acyl-carrier protein] reductase
MFDLGGKSIVITGGGTGIGQAYSQAVAEAGANVVIADLDEPAAEKTATEITARGRKAIAVAGDISKPEDVERLARAAEAAFGRVDGLVNNAALMSTLPRRVWHEIPLEEFDRVMRVNLGGPFLVCRALYPLMRRHGGAIVNISSTRAIEGTPNRLHYTASKAGILGFTKALAREVGGDNIRVNAVAPGVTMSDTQIASSDPKYLAEIGKGRALARQQTPTDLVGAVLFLLSDASAFITGQTLVVDGGKVMW